MAMTIDQPEIWKSNAQQDVFCFVNYEFLKDLTTIVRQVIYI